MSKVFKKWVKEWPIQFFAPIIVLGCFGLRLLTENELIGSILLFITWAAIGMQWLSIYKSTIKNREKRKKQDIERLEEFLGGTILKLMFLVPYKGSIIRKIWNKLSRKTSLSMYAYSEIDLGSFTKYHVTKKELFNLKLNGYINTDSVEIAKKGIAYIEGQK